MAWHVIEELNLNRKPPDGKLTRKAKLQLEFNNTSFTTESVEKVSKEGYKTDLEIGWHLYSQSLYYLYTGGFS